MNIQLNPLAVYLVENISNDAAPHVRSQYDKLIAERDTSDVWRQFALWFLVDPDHGVIRFTKPDSWQYRVIQHVADLYAKNCKDRNAWRKAAWDADLAGVAAERTTFNVTAYTLVAAACAGNDADCNTAWDNVATFRAVVNAAEAAQLAAYAAAADAARAAAYAVDAAKAAAYAIDAKAARLSFYKHMAEKLLELLQLAPPKENV